MRIKYFLTVILLLLFRLSYCQIELSSELEKNKMVGKAASAVKSFQSTLTSLGSNRFNYEEKQSYILDLIKNTFENEKVRIINDIESEGSEDYTIDIYLRNILVWFAPPKEVSFNYKIEKISDVFISDEKTYLFIKVEVSREIDGINNDNAKILNSMKIDIYVKYNIVNGLIKPRARIYSITKHMADMAFTVVPLSKNEDDLKKPETTKQVPIIESSDFEAYPLACTKLNCRTLNFKTEDDLYLFFKSPVAGYLSVFLDDGKDCFKLLPYSLDTLNINSGMPVESQKEYIYFSTEPQFNYNANKFFVEDTYQLTAETPKDINHLYVIFSKNPLNRIDVRKNAEIKILSETEIKKGYSIPQTLTTSSFKTWVNNNINNTKEIVLKDIEITIQK